MGVLQRSRNDFLGPTLPGPDTSCPQRGNRWIAACRAGDPRHPGLRRLPHDGCVHRPRRKLAGCLELSLPSRRKKAAACCPGSACGGVRLRPRSFASTACAHGRTRLPLSQSPQPRSRSRGQSLFTSSGGTWQPPAPIPLRVPRVAKMFLHRPLAGHARRFGAGFGQGDRVPETGLYGHVPFRLRADCDRGCGVSRRPHSGLRLSRSCYQTVLEHFQLAQPMHVLRLCRYRSSGRRGT